jgi:osmotically inducible protein OsmC
MPARTSTATWEGTLREGSGSFVVGDDYFEGEVSFVSRFEDDDEGKTNPEELIGAAHATCFSMAFSAELERADAEPRRIDTSATVHIEDLEITTIELETEAEVSGIDEDEFQEIAEGAKENCPVSKALGGVETITLDATLV